jgi:hypothetical protein
MHHGVLIFKSECLKKTGIVFSARKAESESFLLRAIQLHQMLKMNLSTAGTSGVQLVNSGKPTMPLSGRQPIVERKISDPSSAFPRGERYPIPSFFEDRMKFRESDPK